MTSVTDEVHVSDAPAIPGLRFRRLRDDADYAAIAELISAGSLADGLDFVPDAETLRIDFEHVPDFDPRRDILMAEVDGRLVGYGDASRGIRDGLVVYGADGTVHPTWRRRGLGRAILRATEAHLRERATGYDDGEGRAFGTWTHETTSGGRELLESEGYVPVRYFFQMIRPHLDDVPEAPLPPGLEIREVSAADHRRIFDADNEAFRDHWGHREATDEDFARMFGYPDVDTALWSVGWDGDEVVGSVQSVVWKSENERLGVRRGWLEHISVRREWRRRGVARALIADALRRLRAAGMTEAMLGVDADNPTGALGLYEALGFRVKTKAMAYRKPWQPGGRIL